MTASVENQATKYVLPWRDLAVNKPSEAPGEALVVAKLERLARKDPRWRILHAVPFGSHRSDTDHLAIGPGGVFTINAKHHPNARIWLAGDTLLVDGIQTRYVRNARQEAGRATTLLSNVCGFPVHVHGLVVTVNARDVVIKRQPDGVAVTWRKHLSRTLQGYGEVLPAETIEAIYEVARRSTTWGA